MPIIEVSLIESTVARALRAHGATPEIAASVAKATAHSEAHGNKICGLYYVESYCKQLLSGRVLGDATPEVSKPRPAVVAVNARFGFAQPAFEAGFATALEAVRDNGVASFAVGHAHTCTSLGYFTEQFARAGVIAIGATNASPIVAAPGGAARLIGTNPIACSVPDGVGGMSMHFDFSTSAVALGKITMAKAAGEKIPLGWAVNTHGEPTTDPDEAIAGALLSAGGHKGWGIGLMVEVLAAAMTGGVNSVDVKPLKIANGNPHDLGQYYILIDPAASPEFGERMARLHEAVDADRAARLPGASRHPDPLVNVVASVWDNMLVLADYQG